MAHLKEFFMLGRPEYIASLDKPGLKPHLIKMQDWVSVFSYVLKPDMFLSLCEYVGRQEEAVCREVFKVLFSYLCHPSIYPKEDTQYLTKKTVQVSANHHAELTLLTFSHGSASDVYHPKYAQAIADHIRDSKSTVLIHEPSIDKLHPQFAPTDPRLLDRFNQLGPILSPYYSQSKPLNFNRADFWNDKIMKAYSTFEGQKFNLATTVVMFAANKLDDRHSLHHNVKHNRHLHTWAALTDFSIQLERDIRPQDPTFFRADDWLLNILMGIDLSIQAHQTLCEKMPTSLFMSAGSAHHFHLSLFCDPKVIYSVLIELFTRLSQDFEQPIFNYSPLKTPPRSSMELVNWAQLIS